MSAQVVGAGATVGRLVLPEVLPTVSIQSDADRFRGARRVAFVASWSPDARVTRSLARLVAELEAGGYAVVLTRSSPGPLEWPDDVVVDPAVILKDNLGYDFGSWAVGMALYPHLLEAEHVIVVNDSLVGPFASLQPLLRTFETSPAPVWGVTDTGEYWPHLQSYFMGFHGGVLAQPRLREFWSSIEVLDDKDEIVERYEIGLSRVLAELGIPWTAWIDHETVARSEQNPTLLGWYRLLEEGLPFVKRMLVTHRLYFPYGRDVEIAVRARFGTELEDWL